MLATDSRDDTEEWFNGTGVGCTVDLKMLVGFTVTYVLWTVMQLSAAEAISLKY